MRCSYADIFGCSGICAVRYFFTAQYRISSSVSSQIYMYRHEYLQYVSHTHLVKTISLSFTATSIRSSRARSFIRAAVDRIYADIHHTNDVCADKYIAEYRDSGNLSPIVVTRGRSHDTVYGSIIHPLYMHIYTSRSHSIAAADMRDMCSDAVSYTHLTLPTICSV